MIVQYPYTLQLWQAADSVQDENGNWVPGEAAWVDYCKCRDEAVSNGQQVATTDGVMHPVSLLIQMPKGTQPLTAGDKIQVIDADGSVRVWESKILYSRKDQLHTRAWI